MTDVGAIVIGAGNAGLTAAATLQRAGLRTLLVDLHHLRSHPLSECDRWVSAGRA
ncbi:FAD-binding protein [Streptomyces sp. NPDC050315]|uniref:FAD-binding protein n=1 Tax=Streptomyces sp. NPDC050315 TaxID=3155039 RepID=UPI00342C9752